MDSILILYRRRIYGFLLKYVKIPALAEDLTQDVLIKLWNNQERLYAIEDQESYILAITRNHIRDHFKKTTREEALKEEVRKNLRIKDDSAYRTIHGNELREKVLEVVEDLPDRQKQVYKMKYQQGKSLKNIAEELSLSPHTVKNHLAQAIKTIRSRIDPKEFLMLLIVMSSFLFIFFI